jgi:hypothetical protein
MVLPCPTLVAPKLMSPLVEKQTTTISFKQEATKKDGSEL